MFDPDLNPYVTKMEQHRDIIKTLPLETNKDFFDFVKTDAPLIVDLGCGAGNFLRDYAMQKPDARFVGFELRFKRLVKGAVKFKKRDIDNIKLVQARAEDIADWLPEKAVSEIYVNFPDPWPKKRHHKHRLISQQFLKNVYKLLSDDGNFTFKTDHWDYFTYAAEQVKNCPYLHVKEYSEDLHNSKYNDTNILTEFESLFKGKGFPVYYLKTDKC
ncbi:MAG: tRNA (guanosine(46)-N7)-methyltransferase TrmB [Proteobacteria bacterium]|nr:tRNA (guanosine(46)-N7)-methyltransferase TrmB [Pseudomonadota bacterium]